MVKVITPPASEPVSLAEFKLCMRGVPISTAQEPMVNSILKAGREEAEKYQNAAYMEQTLLIALDAPTSGAIILPRPLFKSLPSVACYDENDIATDITASFAINDIACPAQIKMKDGVGWPSIAYRNQNPVLITYQAGYTTVPEKVKQAILIYAVWAYTHPGGDVPIPDAFYSLLRKGRVIPV